MPITGLEPDDQFIALDFRPADGVLYALTRTRLYRLIPGPSSAAAVPVGAPFTPEFPDRGVGVADVDIDARRDEMRIVVGNYSHRLDLTTGATVGGAIDPTLAYAAGDVNAGGGPNILAHGTTNGVPGASTTTGYAIDLNTSSLVTFDARPSRSPSSARCTPMRAA